MRHPREARDNHAKGHPAGAADPRRMGRSWITLFVKFVCIAAGKDFCCERGVWRIFVRVAGEVCLIPSIDIMDEDSRKTWTHKMFQPSTCSCIENDSHLNHHATFLSDLFSRCLTWYCLAKQSRRVDLARLQASGSLFSRRFRIVTSAAAPRNSWG